MTNDADRELLLRLARDAIVAHVTGAPGPIPPPSDVLARRRELPPLASGDLIILRTAGAYGMSMASQYNARPRPAEVLVDGAEFRVVRRRETLADLVRGESV